MYPARVLNSTSIRPPDATETDCQSSFTYDPTLWIIPETMCGMAPFDYSPHMVGFPNPLHVVRPSVPGAGLLDGSSGFGSSRIMLRSMDE